MKRYKTILWLSFGLAATTICLTLAAYFLGLLPDSYRAEVNSRAKVAESLAVQIVGLVNRRNEAAVDETMASVVARNADVLSVALRKQNGEIITSQGQHDRLWVPSKNGKSTSTHITVPLIGEDGPQGQLEMTFGPLASGERYFDLPASLLVFLGFLAVVGFLVYAVFLRRTLQELDPGRVIPERVQKAFDTLSEGVIIVDEAEKILLVNDAFLNLCGHAASALVGKKINSLPWRTVDGNAIGGDYPWHHALLENREHCKDTLSLRGHDGTVRNLNINAAVICGEKEETIGAIVTLADMTGAIQNAEQLDQAVKLLQESQAEVERQKQELTYLTNHDPKTGCLNRRGFFSWFEAELQKARDAGQSVTVVMMDIDGLRRVKDAHGPAIADSLIMNAANALRAAVPKGLPVNRYGGDGFCFAVIGDQAGTLAEVIADTRTAFMDSAGAIAPELNEQSLGLGLVTDSGDQCSATELVRRADQALQAALRQGRGQNVDWSSVNSAPQAAPSISFRKRSGDSRENKAPEQPTMFSATDVRLHESHGPFLARNRQSIARAERSEKPLAVLKIGIGSWAYFEEALGEELSQTLLQETARHVEKALREYDHISVLTEGGEMLVELSELNQPDDVVWVVNRMLDPLKKPLKIGERDIYVVCKVGAAVFPHDGQDPETLVRHAGVAVRRAWEEDALESLKFYSAEMTQSSLKRLDIEGGTREALKSNEFELFFQPIVDAQSGALSAAECLLRCTSPRMKGARIDEIITVAERSSLIAEIDLWVINAALTQMQAWCDVGFELPKISINLSARQLMNETFMDAVHERLSRIWFAPSRLQIEVTETAKMTDFEVAAPQLKKLQQLGAHVALDDFGTGQASLTYLQRLHPDVLKIDRSFIDGLHKNHGNATMVSAMIVMSHCLGLEVVAEGVETEDELNFLRDLKCDHIQGYYISKPLSVQDMSEWMRADPARRSKQSADADNRTISLGNQTAA